MANWLEDLTKTVSDNKLTRRQVVRRMGGVVAGAALAAWLPEQVLARPVAIPHASSGAWSLTGSMNTTREFHTATLLTNGKVLIAGGFGNNGFLASAELYDPRTGIWSLTGSMNTAREFHAATLLTNGKVLVAGGSPNGYDFLASAELYDPRTGTWSPTGFMHKARFVHTATLLTNGKVLVAGGDSNNVPVASAELYKP